MPGAGDTKGIRAAATRARQPQKICQKPLQGRRRSVLKPILAVENRARVNPQSPARADCKVGSRARYDDKQLHIARGSSSASNIPTTYQILCDDTDFSPALPASGVGRSIILPTHGRW